MLLHYCHRVNIIQWIFQIQLQLITASGYWLIDSAYYMYFLCEWHIQFGFKCMCKKLYWQFKEKKHIQKKMFTFYWIICVTNADVQKVFLAFETRSCIDEYHCRLGNGYRLGKWHWWGQFKFRASLLRSLSQNYSQERHEFDSFPYSSVLNNRVDWVI